MRTARADQLMNVTEGAKKCVYGVGVVMVYRNL